MFRYHWSKLWPYPLKTDGHYCMNILFKWQKNIMLFFLLQKRFFFFYSSCLYKDVMMCTLYSLLFCMRGFVVNFVLSIIQWFYTVHSDLGWIFFFNSYRDLYCPFRSWLNLFLIPIVIYLVHSNRNYYMSLSTVILPCPFRPWFYLVHSDSDFILSIPTVIVSCSFWPWLYLVHFDSDFILFLSTVILSYSFR